MTDYLVISKIYIWKHRVKNSSFPAICLYFLILSTRNQVETLSQTQKNTFDTYSNCSFGCLYCFANSSNLLGRKGWENGDFAQLERFMKKCFETEFVFFINSVLLILKI